MIRYLSAKDIVQIHLLMMNRYGEGEQRGVKEPNLLESAVYRPEQSIFGEDAYPTLFSKAAALFESLNRNHCFYNGNKRTAFSAVDVFLKKNGYKIRMTNEDGERLTLGVATGEIDIEESTKWFEMNSVPYHR